MRRRSFIGSGLAASAAALASSGARVELAAQALQQSAANSAFPQSVCHWCFRGMSVEELAVAARQIGIQSVELLNPGPDFDTLKRLGMSCAMVSQPAGSIAQGWNRLENHDMLIAAYEQTIPVVAAAGFPNLICFSGNRRGMDDEQGLENCAIGLRRIMPVAERHGVTVCMELLNSKIDHADYMCDHTAWGVELARKIDSERFKLLYDIYHMQIMEGDVIRTIRDNHQYIGHYHTAGVPGRNEIDEGQELYYPAIMRAIVDTGYKGYVAQEFIPRRDPITSLAEAYRICDVPQEPPAAGA
jgi:hydroxypyruvate isomerase